MLIKKDNILKSALISDEVLTMALLSADNGIRELRERLGLKEHEKFYVDTPQCKISQMSRTQRNQQVQQPYHFQDGVGVIDNTGMISDIILEQLEVGSAQIVKL